MAIEAPSSQPTEQSPHADLTQDLLFAMSEHVPVGIAILDGRELRIQYANRHFLGLLDEPHRRGSITGLRLTEIIPGAEGVGLQRWVMQVRQAGRAASREGVRMEGSGPGASYWNMTLTPLRQRVAGVPALMLQVADATDAIRMRDERARARLLAEQRAEQLGVAFGQITDGVVVVDRDGKIRRINPAGAAMLDLELPEGRPEEAPGDRPGSASASQLHVDLPPLELALHGQTVRNVEHAIQRRNGETTWINVSSAPLYDRSGDVRGAVAGFQDISERKQLEQIKEDFLAVTAHELRTPVTALLGYINLMVRRAEQADWADRDLHALRMIETQAQRLTELINGLIDVSRVQTGTIELHCQPVDVHVLARQAAAALSTNAVEHRIVVDGPEQPVTVCGDPRRLDQVITHLIGNALKYSPWGGIVQVRVWMDSEAHIAVTDAGIGVPEEALPQLFQRFYRASNVDSDRISGLGIGLYLVKELVAAHGGRIDVRSGPDGGTTFEIALPLFS